MMLTIHGLPVMVKYHDLKTLIKQECKMTDFILDNLVGDLDGYKKVRIGVSDEAEGAHLSKCLNGYRMGGNVLRVVPLAKGPTNLPQNNFDQRGGFIPRNDVPNQPGNFGTQPMPLMGNRSAPWGPGTANQNNQWGTNQPQPNQIPQTNFGFQQQGPPNQPFSQQPGPGQRPGNKPFPQSAPYTQTQPAIDKGFGFGSAPHAPSHTQGPRRTERAHVLRSVELVHDPQRSQQINRFQQENYEPNKPVTINKDYFQGSSQFSEPQPNYPQGPGQSSSWNKQPMQQQKPPQFEKGPQFDDNKRPMGHDKGRFSPQRGPHERRASPGRERRMSPGRKMSPGRRMSPGRKMSPGRRMSPGRKMSPGRRMSPGRKMSPGRRISPGRRLSPGDRRLPGRKSPGRHESPPKRISPNRRLVSPGRRFSPPRRNPEKGYPDRGSQSKQIRPAYEPDGKAPNQAMYSGGYRPNAHDVQYPGPGGRQMDQREPPWQQDRDKYPGQMKKPDDDRRDARMPISSRGPEPMEPNRPSPMHKSRSPNRRDVRERSPLRDRYKRHSPSPRSPRRSWALEKRRSPDINQAPPPPMWPGQNQDEQYGRDKGESGKHVPVWDHRTLAETEEAMRRENRVYIDERLRRDAGPRDLPNRRESSPRRHGFKPHDEDRFSPKNNRDPKFEPRDSKLDLRDPKFDQRDPKFELRDPKFDIRDPKFDQRDPKFDLRGPKYEPRDPKFEPRGPKFEPRDPKFESRDPKFESRNPKFEPRDPKFEPRDPKFEPREPKFELRDPKFESRNPKFEPRDPKFEPRDPKLETRGPKFEPRDPKFEPRDPKFDPRDLKFDPRDPKFEPRDPKFEPHDSKFEPRAHKFEPREHQFEPRDQMKMGPPSQSHFETRGSRFEPRDTKYEKEAHAVTFEPRDPKFGTRGPTFEPRDPKFEQRGAIFDPRDRQFEPRDPKFEQREPNVDQDDHKYDLRGPKFELRDPKFEPREPKFEPRDLKFEPRDPKFEPRDLKFESRDPKFGPRDPKFGPRDPKFEHRDPKFELRGLKYERENKFKPTFEPIDPTFEERDPKFVHRDSKYGSRDKFDARDRKFEPRGDYKDQHDFHLDDDPLGRKNEPERDNFREYQRPGDRPYRDEFSSRREEFPRSEDRKDSRPPHDVFQKEFEDIYKRTVEFKQKVQELRRSDRDRGDYPREDRRREPERDDRRKLGDSDRQHDSRDNYRRDMDRHSDDHSRPRREDRSRSPILEENKKRHDEDKIEHRDSSKSKKVGLAPDVQIKRDKAVENIASKMLEKYGNFEMSTYMRLRVKEDLQVAISRILHDMFGTKDISFIEMVVKFNSKHDQRAEQKIFEEVISCFPNHQYKSMKRSAQDSDRSEVPAKTSKISPAEDVNVKGDNTAVIESQAQIPEWNFAFGPPGFITNMPMPHYEAVPQMGLPMNPNPMMVPPPFTPPISQGVLPLEKEDGYNLYLCKDDFKPFTEMQADFLKKFLVGQIFKVTETSNGWAPEFTLKGLQSMFRYEMHTYDEDSKNWLLNFDFSEFSLFSVLVYTKEELWYERAAIWLPSHSRCRHIEPLDKLKLQNKKLENANVGKWKLVKKIVNAKGTRIYVDMPPSSARALEKHKMMLSYELQKVNVFLKAVAVDKDAYDAGLQEISVTDPSVIVAAAKASPMPSLKEDPNIVKVSLKGSKSLSLEQVRKIKEMIIYHMFKYHLQKGSNSKTDFIKYGFCSPNSLGLLPENQESKRWLTSVDIGRLNRQPIVILGGDSLNTRYLKMFITVASDHNGNAAIVAERLKQSNQGVKGINFNLWKPITTVGDRSKFKFEVEVDLESAETISKMKFRLDYVDDRCKTRLVHFKPEFSLSRFTELIQKYKAELTDSYDVANMELASSDEDIICLEDLSE